MKNDGNEPKFMSGRGLENVTRKVEVCLRVATLYSFFPAPGWTGKIITLALGPFSKEFNRGSCGGAFEELTNGSYENCVCLFVGHRVIQLRSNASDVYWEIHFFRFQSCNNIHVL
jgi:hypothetical protein